MSDVIVIRFDNNDTDTVSWIRMSADGQQRSGVAFDELVDVAQHTHDQRVLVLVPATEVSLFRMHIPVRSKSKMLQAVPFAMEEHLTEDVDKLHFAVGKRNDDGKVDIAVVRHDDMNRWMQCLAEAGINPSSVLADSHGIPGAPGHHTVLLDEQRIYSRDELGRCIALDAGGFEDVAEFLDWNCEPEQSAEDSETVENDVDLEIYATEERYERDKTYIESLHVLLKSLEVRLLRDGPLPLLASHIIGQGGINLRQGQYSPSKNLSALWQPWRVAASLLLAFVLVALGTKATEIFQLKREEVAIRQAQITLLQQTFPDIRNITDPLRQMRSRIGGADTGASAEDTFFLETLYTIGKAVAAHQSTKIESVSFGNKVMDIRLRVPNVEILDKIHKQIADNEAIEALIQSANQSDGSIEGRLQIEWTGA